VTLILTVNGPETHWMLADRRLSYRGRPPKDDARKMMVLQAEDGHALLGYAGLGATAGGTEPADWMSAVLRGRKGPLEILLAILFKAMIPQFPKHMRFMLGIPAHRILIAAFLNKEARLYRLDLEFNPDRSPRLLTLARETEINFTRVPRVEATGSGAAYLGKTKNKWMRGLLRMVKAHDRGQVSPLAVADYLANLNYEVHQNDKNGWVGPRCIVAWQRKEGGGSNQSYTGTVRDRMSFAEFRDRNDPLMIPTIMAGADAVAAAMKPFFLANVQAVVTGQPAKDYQDEINKAFARIPRTPDEKLR
jgi:hypothetical protein